MLKLKLQYMATSCEELTHWKRLWCWEGLGAGGEGEDRGRDGWMASPTWWTWVWVNSGSWWTGRPGVLQFMGSQRVGHDWATELNWTEPSLSLQSKTVGNASLHPRVSDWNLDVWLISCVCPWTDSHFPFSDYSRGSLYLIKFRSKAHKTGWLIKWEEQGSLE